MAEGRDQLLDNIEEAHEDDPPVPNNTTGIYNYNKTF